MTLFAGRQARAAQGLGSSVSVMYRVTRGSANGSLCGHPQGGVAVEAGRARVVRREAAWVPTSSRPSG
jgi:hypothetical protein